MIRYLSVRALLILPALGFILFDASHLVIFPALAVMTAVLASSFWVMRRGTGWIRACPPT